jgi:serine/threonine protein kinase/WD40 repeat protein/tetratricopeptide (TPR) repeat protein
MVLRPQAQEPDMAIDFQRVQGVFQAVAELPPAERAVVLERECGDDAELRHGVEALLQAHDDSRELPTADPERTGPPVSDVELGQVFGGRYKLRQKLGEGGMGVVFVADQIEPVQRRVAMKIVRTCRDTHRLLARFEQERQALALMDHPNIAKVFDGGLDPAGRPYFAMELVKGQPLTRYCDDARLSPRERLELFIPVCQAVQHAHQKGVIHRDLKPSNILVGLYDGKPVPKVIDFGLAKAMGPRLTAQSVYTEVGNLIGTLEYMSPEQAELNNLDIDTRSDIYALGVILYELLTGVVPFSRKELAKADLAEILRVIKETEPAKPSTKLSHSDTLPRIAAQRHMEPHKLTALVRGELDWIVMKALEKDRGRRYETANGFAQDVQRYLAGEPVLAAPASQWYRLRKFVRRHRGPLTTAGVVLAALVLGMAVSIEEAVRATRAEGLAQHRLEAEIEARAQAHANLEDARRAEREKTEKLALSNFKEAQAKRWSGLVGRRFESLELLKMAADLYRGLDQLDGKRTLDLRNEAIACLALADLKPGKEWHQAPGWSRPDAFDPTLQFYVVRPAADDDPTKPDLHKGQLSVRRVVDDWEVALLGGFGVRVVETRFSPDGRCLAALYKGGNDHVKVWDLSRRAPVVQVSYGSSATLPTFSPDSRLVALSWASNSIRIQELSSGATWKDLPPSLPGRLVHFHPDGRRMAVVNGSTVQLRDLNNGMELARFKHPGNVFQMAWRDDGKVFATGCYDHDIYLWDVAKPAQQLRVLKGHLAEVFDLAFSHAGDLLISQGWDSTTRLWDAMTGQQLLSMPGGQYRELYFGPDDRGLGPGWQVAAGRECRTFHGRTLLHWVAICPRGPFGGRLMASASDDGVRLWDLAATREGDKELATLPVGSCGRVHFDPNGESLITDGKVGLQRWPVVPDPQGGLQIGPPQSLGLSARAPLVFPGYDPESALSADGLTIAHSPQLGQVLLFELANPGRTLLIESPLLRFPAFSADGRWLATGNWGWRGVRVWDARTGRPEHDFDLGGPEERAAWPAFSPDGKWLATGTAAEYRFWEVGSWNKRHGLSRENAGQTPGWIVFSPDGQVLAVRHSMTEVRLVDPATGREFARLPAAGSPICFSPDGSQLVTDARSDGAFQVWDLREIRRQLKEMGLDWDRPPYPPPTDSARPLRVRVVAAEPPPPSNELDAQAFRERGLVYVQLRLYGIATDDFNQARVLDPERFPWEEVVRSYSQAIKRNPQDAEAYFHRGQARWQLGQWAEAIQDWAEAIRLQPHIASWHTTIGSVYALLGQWDKAYAEYAKGDPQHYREAALAYACLFLMRGDSEGYNRFCQGMIQREAQTENSSAAFFWARTCAMGRKSPVDPARAVQWANQAVANKQAPLCFHVLGLAQYRAGQFDQALQSFTKADDKAWAQRELNWFGLALVHHRLGHPDEARQCLDKGIQWLEREGPPGPERPAKISLADWMEAQVLRREAEEMLKTKRSP